MALTQSKVGSTLQAHQPLKIANSNLFISFVRADLQAMFFSSYDFKTCTYFTCKPICYDDGWNIYYFSGCAQKFIERFKIETSLQIRKGSCEHFRSFFNEWSLSIEWQWHFVYNLTSADVHLQIRNPTAEKSKSIMWIQITVRLCSIVSLNMKINNKNLSLLLTRFFLPRFYDLFPTVCITYTFFWLL